MHVALELMLWISQSWEFCSSQTEQHDLCCMLLKTARKRCGKPGLLLKKEGSPAWVRSNIYSYLKSSNLLVNSAAHQPTCAQPHHFFFPDSQFVMSRETSISATGQAAQQWHRIFVWGDIREQHSCHWNGQQWKCTHSKGRGFICTRKLCIVTAVPVEMGWPRS